MQAGPIIITTESGSILQFDVGRILSWIDAIFSTISDKWHTIGRRALKNLIVHNKEQPFLLERSIEVCYVVEQPKALESYIEVVTQVLIECTDYPLCFWRVLGAVLVTLGNQKREIRMKSAKLLRILEERQQKNSRLQDFDISISDKTTTVYKLAQFETSKRLAKQHADLAFAIFSEFTLHFKSLSPDSQRNMVAAILPWVQVMELQIDPSGGPTAKSYMLLANLSEITIRCGNILPNEVQALWQALATGPHGGNVQLILDFVITTCLERKDQNFVDYAKQVVVYLSGTPAGSKVIEFLLMQVEPKQMVQEKKGITPPPSDIKSLPYVTDLRTVLPVGNRQVRQSRDNRYIFILLTAQQAGVSLGQLAVIFLVDLMVAPVALPLHDIVKLLHVVLSLWDHYVLTVQEQAREMLVHLIHELVAAKVDDDEPIGITGPIEDFVDSIRTSDSRVVWPYEDDPGKYEAGGDRRVPAPMATVMLSVVRFFSFVHEGIDRVWAKEALNWATSCPVRHLACRSFQIFRCLSNSVDSRMLADMLARLSNTIADEETDYQPFSMEILTTLKIIISALTPPDLLRCPQLFWTTCACLNTIHEIEFIESLAMLDKFLDNIDISDPAVASQLFQGRPAKWEGEFSGIQNLVYKGLKSCMSLDRTLEVLHRLSSLPTNSLIGDSSRLLFAILANLPHFLYRFDVDCQDRQERVIVYARLLAQVAEAERRPRLADALQGFVDGHYAAADDFLRRIVAEIRSYYFPQQDVPSLIFVLGLLTNTIDWFRVRVMDILLVLIPLIDMRRPEVTCHGPDLISPLLRLLQTDLCPPALAVMDKIMTVTGNPMERHHIRMSMASPSSSRAIRKEYEHVRSLYGIPEPTGWSIPIPAEQSSITRANVHAVFYTSAEVDHMEAQKTTRPDVEFHEDGYGDGPLPPARADTMQSVDTQADSNIGDILQKLDSLDYFFEDAETYNPAMMLDVVPGSAQRALTGQYVDTNANLYDQQTAPILCKSLARTASTSSFHNGLAESRPGNPGLDNNNNNNNNNISVAFPTSSATTTLPSPPPMQTSRPLMHIRSVTSPANSLIPATLSDPHSMPPIGPDELAFLSDNDAEYNAGGGSDFRKMSMTARIPQLSRSDSKLRNATDGSTSIESMIRSGVKRLTNSRERDRQPALAQGIIAPQVPRIPVEYHASPMSSPSSRR